MPRIQQKIRIIIVDTNERWRKDALEYLEDADIESTGYPDLITAMKALNNTNGKSSLVFVDLHLARQSPALFKILSNRTINPHLFAVVMFPTQLTVADMIYMFNLGAYDSYDKPYGRVSTSEMVTKFINEVLNLHQVQPQPASMRLAFNLTPAMA
ncbi:hypothetical protein MNBD_CHLOROFLEXI01-5046 [hydrothermal vent metagenome]|uniref:Response regulatory domain-containing protein n=1 Tax=hydrothermal vent metagenome TaxID=652676 RepID=A0A3B0V6S7_9ZZZZ